MRKMLRWYEWLRPLMADDSAGNEQTDWKWPRIDL
jgi:hypothetical protein